MTCDCFLHPHKDIGAKTIDILNTIYSKIQAEKVNKKELALIFKKSFIQWRNHNAPISAAALTFFIILPLPSLLLIVVTIFSQFYGQTVAQQQIIQQITLLAGPVVAQLFQQLLESALSPFTSLWVGLTVVAF